MTQDAPDANPAASDVPAKAERPTMSDAVFRRYIDERFADIADQFDAGNKRMGKIETSLEKNTALTSGVHDILEAARTGFKVLGWLGEGMRWLVKFAAPFIALWALFHGSSDSHHEPPK